LNTISNKYIRFIVTIILFAPLLSYVTLGVFKKDFMTTTMILSIFGIVLLIFFRDENNPIIFPKYLLYLFLFILYITFMDFVILGKKFDAKYFYADRVVGTFYVFFLIENFKISKKYYNFIIKYSKPILVIAILVIVLQQGYNDSFLVNPYYQKVWGSIGETENRLPSIYSYLGGGLSTGLGFVPIFIIVVEYLYKRKKNVSLWILGGFIFAFLSKYRWIMLDSLLVLFVLIANNKSKMKQVLKYSIILPFFLIASLFALKAVGIKADKIIEERILESDNNNNTTSYSTRILAIYSFNKVFWDNPIFGVGNIKYGFGGSGKQDYKLRKLLRGHSSQLHIGYLSLLYYYGIIGGVLYFCFLYFLLYKKLFKNATKTRMYGPFLGMLCFAITNLAMVSFALLEIGLIISLVVDNYYINDYKNKLNYRNIVGKK